MVRLQCSVLYLLCTFVIGNFHHPALFATDVVGVCTAQNIRHSISGSFRTFFNVCLCMLVVYKRLVSNNKAVCPTVYGSWMDGWCTRKCARFLPFFSLAGHRTPTTPTNAETPWVMISWDFFPATYFIFMNEKVESKGAFPFGL